MNTSEKLEQLSDYKDAYAAELNAFNAARDAILAKVQNELDEVGAEFSPRLAQASEKIALLEKEVKLAVEEEMQTVKGTRLQAVYSRGRQTWDNAKLTKYAETHLEVLAYSKVGEPSVSLREVKAKE